MVSEGCFLCTCPHFHTPDSDTPGTNLKDLQTPKPQHYNTDTVYSLQVFFFFYNGNKPVLFSPCCAVEQFAECRRVTEQAGERPLTK